MIRLLKKFFTTRRTVTTEILAIIAAVFIAGIVPQRIQSSVETISQWRLQHAALVPLADILHLHTVYTSYWFVSVILLTGISLGFSTVEQIRSAFGRIKAVSPSDPPLAVINDMSPGLVERIFASGYRSQQTDCDGVYKFIRCKWGYWGAPLFHLGMLLVLVASCFIALTEQRGALTIAQCEMLAPADEWISTEEGLLAQKLRLPATFRFDDLRVLYDEKNAPEQIESLVTFIRNDGTEDLLNVAVNGVSSYQGVRIYHTNEYGAAFSLELTGPDGMRHVEKLLISHPDGAAEAGYLDTVLPWLPYTLSAKYFADVERRSMNSADSQLILRLMSGKDEVARISLLSGQSGQLGGYRVRLLAVDKWAKFIFVYLNGIEIVFAGFSLMMIGALLSYLMPPRELVIILQGQGNYEVFWRAAKFSEFYAEERNAVVDLLCSVG